MSGSVDRRQISFTVFENNWRGLQTLAAIPPSTDTGIKVIGLATIEFEETSINKLIYGFDVHVKGKNRNRPCAMHLNLTEVHNPAHITVVGWEGGPKQNRWFRVNPNGSIEGCAPPHGHKPKDSSKWANFSSLPSELVSPLKWVITQCYNGVYD